MSQSPMPNEPGHEFYTIPSLLTTSLRTVLSQFGESIIGLRAHGGPIYEDRDQVDDLRDYGVTHKQTTHHELEIDYTRLTEDGDPFNPLDAGARKKICEEMDTRLTHSERKVDSDIPVKRLEIRIESNAIQNAVDGCRSDIFDLTFQADAAEDPIRKRTREKNRGRGLYDELGWNINNLNLRVLEETEAKLTEQSDPTIIKWQGPEDTYPRTDTDAAKAVYEDVLPGDYSELKFYYVGEDEVLELADEDILDVQTETSL